MMITNREFLLVTKLSFYLVLGLTPTKPEQSFWGLQALLFSPQPVMSQPYPVPIPLPQSKSRPLPDSRGIPDTFNLFLFGKPIGLVFNLINLSNQLSK